MTTYLEEAKRRAEGDSVFMQATVQGLATVSIAESLSRIADSLDRLTLMPPVGVTLTKPLVANTERFAAEATQAGANDSAGEQA